MPKRPSMQWYPGDWLKDPAVGQCSPLARGILMDVLCLMHENRESGEITGTIDGLARACRCASQEMEQAVDEFLSTGALDVTWVGHVTESPKKVTLVSRRMARNAKEKENNRLRKRRQRSPSDVPDLSRSHSSTSTSVGGSYRGDQRVVSGRERDNAVTPPPENPPGGRTPVPEKYQPSKSTLEKLRAQKITPNPTQVEQFIAEKKSSAWLSADWDAEFYQWAVRNARRLRMQDAGEQTEQKGAPARMLDKLDEIERRKRAAGEW